MKKLVSWSVLSVALVLTLLLGTMTTPAHASTGHLRATTAPPSASITTCKFPTASLQISNGQYFYFGACAVPQLINLLAAPNPLLQRTFGLYAWTILQNDQATLQSVLISNRGNGIWIIFTPGVGNCAGFNLPFAVLAGNFFSVGSGFYGCSGS